VSVKECERTSLWCGVNGGPQFTLPPAELLFVDCEVVFESLGQEVLASPCPEHEKSVYMPSKRYSGHPDWLWGFELPCLTQRSARLELDP
jgi:hypothetical protein